MKERYPLKVYEYYLKKMEEIRTMEHPERSDLWKFYHAVDDIFEFDYRSMDRILLRQIIEDHINVYDRDRIMDHFIKMVEERVREEKEK